MVLNVLNVDNVLYADIRRTLEIIWENENLSFLQNFLFNVLYSTRDSFFYVIIFTSHLFIHSLNYVYKICSRLIMSQAWLQVAVINVKYFGSNNPKNLWNRIER